MQLLKFELAINLKPAKALGSLCLTTLPGGISRDLESIEETIVIPTQVPQFRR
jgi:hypothetical protein